MLKDEISKNIRMYQRILQKTSHFMIKLLHFVMKKMTHFVINFLSHFVIKQLSYFVIKFHNEPNYEAATTIDYQNQISLFLVPYKFCAQYPLVLRPQSVGVFLSLSLDKNCRTVSNFCLKFGHCQQDSLRNILKHSSLKSPGSVA